VIDPVVVMGDAEASLRKIQHALRSEISRRLLIDIESLLGSIRMIEVSARAEEPKPTEPRRHD